MATADEGSGTRALAEKGSEWIGYEALDASGKRIGEVKAAWEDAADRLTYLGIATGWLGLGRIHVVPARETEVSRELRQIRMPFEASVNTMGPDFDADYEITEEGERLIRAYYRDRGPDGDADFNPDPGDPSMYTGHDKADPGWAAESRSGTGTEPDGLAALRPDLVGSAARDWGARTDAPMAYGEPIGSDRENDGSGKALAGPESIEEGWEETDPDPEDRPFR